MIPILPVLLVSICALAFSVPLVLFCWVRGTARRRA